MVRSTTTIPAEQPIKRIAFLREVRQVDFARETKLPYAIVSAVFNGWKMPDKVFIAKACKYFALPAAELFDDRPARNSTPKRVHGNLNVR